MNGRINMILRAEYASCDTASGRAGPVSIDCCEHAFTLLWGEEGCGKNVLLRMLGLLEVPASGEIFFRGTPTRKLSEEARTEIRNVHFGYLFAEPFLLPSLSLIENIAMPLLRISVPSSDEARNRTQEVLDFISLPDPTECHIDRLPIFEQHKIALARALVNRPEVLIVENVDAALDGNDLQQFVDLLRRANMRFGTTLVVTALDQGSIPFAEVTIRMVDGMVSAISNEAGKKGDAVA